MSDARVPRPPRGTGPAGRKLWTAIVGEFHLDEHEMVLLRQAVRVADTCEDLQAVVEADGALITDRFGQPRTNPALVELRSERLLLARLCVALRVPLGDQDSGESAKSPQRRAPRRAARGFYAVNGGRS